MRWEYEKPQEKLLVSDGKTVYWVDMANKQANTEDVKNISDDKIPIMSLVGRSGLAGQFERFEEPRREPLVPGMRVVRAIPRKKDDIREVELEVDPSTFWIHRLVLSHSDDSRSEFVFTNIRVNSNLDPSRFSFKLPPGIDVVKGLGL